MVEEFPKHEIKPPYANLEGFNQLEGSSSYDNIHSLINI